MSDAGDVMYVLPRGVRGVLVQKSIQQKLEPVLAKAKVRNHQNLKVHLFFIS